MLSIATQASGLALQPREKPGQWGSSQTYKDHGSIKAGQVPCLPTSLEGHHNTLVCGRVLISPPCFPKLQAEYGLELLEMSAKPNLSF